MNAIGQQENYRSASKTGGPLPNRKRPVFFAVATKPAFGKMLGEDFP
jgi:hypothetical protein